MNTVLLQLERLRRHYDIAVRTYDEVSFLDLSHTLRVWTELKRPLQTIAPDFSAKKSFKTAIPARKVFKAARGCQYVFACMPGGVITYASKGALVSGPLMDPGSVELEFMIQPTHMILKRFYHVSKVFDRSLTKALKSVSIKRCTFIQWLGAEAVRVAYQDQQTSPIAVSISREMIIKRVANTLDGSHPSSAGGGEVDNKFDGPVKHLLMYGMGGLPLPYFILLKIAQDILDVAPKLLDINERGR